MPQQEQSDESRSFHLEAGGVVFEKPKSQEEIARETRDREQHEFARDQVKTNRRLAWFTGLLVVGTFIGTAIGIWQASIAQTAANAAKDAARAAQDTVKEAITTREESVKDAQRARDLSIIEGNAADQRDMAAMEASNRQSRAGLDASIEASRNDQRAWLGVMDFRLEKEPTANEGMKITFTLQNTGKTPSLKVRSFMLLSIQSTEPDVPNWSQITATVNAVIFPGSFIRDVAAVMPGTNISPSDLALYNVLRVIPNAIWIRVRIDYDDVFNRHHWVQTCGKHGPATALDKFDQCLTGIDVDSPTNANPQSQK